MSQSVTPLADDFDPATRESWLALVDKTLKGAGIETLTSHLADGVDVKPLSTRADAAAPIAFPRPIRGPERAWDLRSAVRHPDRAKANVAILNELAGGAGSVLVAIDPAGADGVSAGSADDLARVLDGVMTDIAPVALDAGFLGSKAADWLVTAVKAAPAAPLALHMDPLSALAREGASPGPIEAHVIAAAGVGVRLSQACPKASLFLASGRAVHEAGGSAAWELAVMAAGALAYAKALARAGLSVDEAFARVVLGLTADADYFASIAKLRAARVLWAKITAACDAQAPASLEVRSSGRMLTQADPWTNLVRLTTAGFAAAVGGADAIVLGAFTDALGLPTDFARRQARNTQLVLMEEANLGRVADPAGGAWYLESLTSDLARAAWERFQAIEAAGGLAAALESGLIAREVAEGRETLKADIAEGRAKIVGVTHFRNAEPAPVEVETAPPTKAAKAPSARLPGPDSICPPLTPVRLEELAA